MDKIRIGPVMENTVIRTLKLVDTPEEYVKNTTYGSLQGTVPPRRGILTEHFKVPKTNEVYPIYNEFMVPDGYKFLKVRSWYPCFYIDVILF